MAMREMSFLGYDNVKSYEKEYCYFGATVGRYANRISDAKVILMEWNISLRLMTMRTVFTVAQMVFLSASGLFKEQKADEITFEIEDADLEQGFPGMQS